MSLFVSAEILRIWAEKLEARSVLPHLVRRLVQATGTGITELNFPAYESVQRPGFDGLVSCTAGNAWVPSGRSMWELSTEDGVRGKAQGDFDKRSTNPETKIPKEVQEQSYFIFLPPRRFNQKAEWAEEQSRSPDCHWRGVRAYDADDLEQWVDTVGELAFISQSHGRNRKRGHSTFLIVMAWLADGARTQDRVLQPSLSASEYHQTECSGQGCVEGPFVRLLFRTS